MPAAQELNPLAALHTLEAYLESRHRAGKDRIWLSPEARTALREICRMKPGRMVFAKPEPPPSPPVPISPPETARLEEVAAASAAVTLPKGATTLSIDERRARLTEVAQRAESSPKARALGSLRETMVFATGNPAAKLMLVGEAPGAQEERLREPFVGPAGQLLDRVLRAMGLERSSAYITNVCKFRPRVEGSQGNANRKPTLTEMLSCLDFLHEEIAIIQPAVIVALGGTAAEGLLQKPVTVSRLRGQWLEYQGIPLMVTFHPSYLLRKETDGEETANAEKRKHWEDMLMVMERLGMSVSEKQRGYFLTKQK
jgi:DNA polymerase